jgi:hypothetical protein
VTRLRKRMLEEPQWRNHSEGRTRAYLQAVQQLVSYFGIIPVNRAMDTKFSSLDFAAI